MNKKLLGALVVLSLGASNAFAGTTSKIKKIEFGPQYGDIIHIDMVVDNTTACATNGAGFDYSFDGGTQTGNKIFSVLLAAQRSGSEVHISGMGKCTLNSDTEDLRWIQSK